MTETNSKFTLSLVYSLLIVIAGVIGIIAVFLAWMKSGDTASGWDLVRGADNWLVYLLNDSYPRWIPAVVLIFSVVATISGLSTLIKPNKAGGSVAAVSGAIALIAAVLFIVYYTAPDGGPDFYMMEYVAVGAYLAAVAGLLMLLFGALRGIGRDRQL